LQLAGDKDRSNLVRLSAARAAAKINPQSGKSAEMQSMIPVLIRVLENGSYYNRIGAADTLREMGAAAQSALPALEKTAAKPLPELSEAAKAWPVEPIPEAVKKEKQLYFEAENVQRSAREAIEAIRKDAEER
jgi:hypothetical protein